MSEQSATPVNKRKTPWHVWTVGILTLLWNGSGAYTIMMAQAGRLPGISQDEAAYYAAQQFWFVLTTDIALLAPVAAGIALLLRSRIAVWLFVVSLAAIFLNNLYDLAAGTSRMLVNQGAIIFTVTIVVIAALQLVYALFIKRRAVLT